MPESLLDQIENGALDSSVPLADVLRKCVALGGASGSAELRDWALHELNGYDHPDELPEYRTVPAMIAVDGATMVSQVTQQRIRPSALPDFVQDRVGETFQFFVGVGELEAMRKDNADSVKMSLPMGADIAAYMNSQTANQGSTIVSVYWVISTVSVAGVLDRVRTSLVGLVAEIRATQGDGAVPDAETASQAVHVIIDGGKRNTINVNTVQGAGQSVNTQTASALTPEETAGPVWRFFSKPGTLLMGVVAIAALLVGVAEWQGWNPF